MGLASHLVVILRDINNIVEEILITVRQNRSQHKNCYDVGGESQRRELFVLQFELSGIFVGCPRCIHFELVVVLGGYGLKMLQSELIQELLIALLLCDDLFGFNINVECGDFVIIRRFGFSVN